MRTIRVLAITIVCFCGWGAPQRPAPPRPAAPSHAATPPRGSTARATRPQANDAQLEAAIRAKFAKSKIGADKFTVHVHGGVATIEGKTDVVQHKGTATRMARTAGALAVNNRVEISEAARDKAAANLEKGRRRAQIKRGDSRSAPRSSDRQPRSGGE